MRTELCEAVVSFEGPHVEVTFNGTWTKRMIDIAHNSMIRALPGHLQELRKTIETSKTEETEESEESETILTEEKSND